MFSSGDLQAIEDFDTAINLNSKYGEAYYHRAQAYEKLGKKDLAKKDEQMAKKLGYVPQQKE